MEDIWNHSAVVRDEFWRKYVLLLLIIDSGAFGDLARRFRCLPHASPPSCGALLFHSSYCQDSVICRNSLLDRRHWLLHRWLGGGLGQWRQSVEQSAVEARCRGQDVLQLVLDCVL